MFKVSASDMKQVQEVCKNNNTTPWKETCKEIKEVFEKAVTKVQNTYNEMKIETCKPRGFKI